MVEMLCLPVEEPRPRVVGHPADGNIVSERSDVNDIALHRIHIVVSRTACTSDDIERVLMKI